MSFCPKCGQQLPENPQICPACGDRDAANARQADPPVSVIAPAPVKTYGLATVSLVISILGICSGGALGILGTVLGIVALVKINGSNGMLSGKNIAIGAIAAGAVSVFVGVFMLGVFSAVLIPLHIKGQTQAKQNEAKNILRLLAVHQEMYYAEHGKYGNSLDKLGLPPDIQTEYYAIFMNQSIMQPTKNDPYPLPFETATYVNDDSYLIVAAGNIDNDEVLDVWVLGQDANLVHVSDDVSLYKAPSYEQGHEY